MNKRVHNTVCWGLSPFRNPRRNDVFMPTTSCPFRSSPGLSARVHLVGTHPGLERTGQKSVGIKTHSRLVYSGMGRQDPPQRYERDHS